MINTIVGKINKLLEKKKSETPKAEAKKEEAEIPENIAKLLKEIPGAKKVEIPKVKPKVEIPKAEAKKEEVEIPEAESKPEAEKSENQITEENKLKSKVEGLFGKDIDLKPLNVNLIDNVRRHLRRTPAKLKLFQKYMNITVDGKWGKQSIKAFNTYVAKRIGNKEYEKYEKYKEYRKHTEHKEYRKHREYKEKNPKMLGMVLKTFSKLNRYIGLKYITANNFLGLIKFESNFNPNDKTRRSTAVGLCQITKTVITDIQKYPNRYNQKVLKFIGKRHKISYLKNNRFRKNNKINIALGMLYLKRLEGYKKSHLTLHHNEKNGINQNKKNIYNRVKVLLRNKNIKISRANFKKLFDDVLHNRNTQTKFCIFKRYNGDKNRYSKERLPHKYYYAFTVLYLGKYVY